MRCVLIPEMSSASTSKDIKHTQGEGTVGRVVSLSKGYDLRHDAIRGNLWLGILGCCSTA